MKDEPVFKIIQYALQSIFELFKNWYFNEDLYQSVPTRDRLQISLPI